MKDDFIPKIIKIESIETQSRDTKLLKIKRSLKHDPGQFMQLSVFNVGEAPISISSYNPKYLEFLVRAVGNTTNALHKLKKGDKIGIRGPYGKGYPMEDFENNRIIIIGGGCGVAPVRSVIQYVEHNQKKFNGLDIYLGFRSPDEILFKKDLKKWKKIFNVYISVDKNPIKDICSQGTVVDLLNIYKPDNKNKIVVICGPPIMIKFAVEKLKELNFNDDQIFLSYERLMQCGTGKCNHCIIGGKYVCKDGPVFRYDLAKWLED